MKCQRICPMNGPRDTLGSLTPKTAVSVKIQVVPCEVEAAIFHNITRVLHFITIEASWRWATVHVWACIVGCCPPCWLCGKLGWWVSLPSGHFVSQWGMLATDLKQELGALLVWELFAIACARLCVVLTRIWIDVVGYKLKKGSLCSQCQQAWLFLAKPDFNILWKTCNQVVIRLFNMANFNLDKPKWVNNVNISKICAHYLENNSHQEAILQGKTNTCSNMVLPMQKLWS